MSLLYLLVKALYLLNAAFQFFILNHFWGIQTFIDLYKGCEWTDSGVFPRVTSCDFEIREAGNIHHHTVQCVLKINMLSEKIHLFLWRHLALEDGVGDYAGKRIAEELMGELFTRFQKRVTRENI